jgi:adenosylmethionine-8-amino-7-oxononanoate aminotransferase
MSITELERADRAHIIHPYLPSTTTERVIMARGKGCSLFDVQGREYLDATGGLWLAQVGHGREELAQVAAQQMRTLEYFTSFWEFSNDKAIALAERLATLAPTHINHVYFTSGGSEGNEAAIKMARYFHYRNSQPDRNWIIARRNAYHGTAFGGSSASGFDVYHDGFGPMLPHVAHVSPAWPYRSELYDGQDPTDFLVAELEETIARLGPQNIAAMVGEPIMGVGGMLVPPDDYWPRISALLKSHGILLIFDEVVTAYGRVGEWFAAQHFGIDPDIIVTAKGITSGYIPLGAVLVSDVVAETLGRDHGFPMGYTYNGHPTAAAVALANLDIIEGEGLLDAAKTTGAYLHAGLSSLLDLDIVGEVRHVGMMLAVELVADRATRAPLPMLQPMLPDVIRRETGVIVRDCAHNLVLSPPLIMTRDEADRAVEGIRQVLRRTTPDGVIHD